jgi:hypothetical protein
VKQSHARAHLGALPEQSCHSLDASGALAPTESRLDPWATRMQPTYDQIQVAAYHLWEQHGRHHGFDREDWETAGKQLMYSLNYEPILEYDLAEPVARVLGQMATRQCRFCETTSSRVRFGPPSAIIPIVSDSSLLTAEICQECESECRDPLTHDLHRFWESLRSHQPLGENHMAIHATTSFSLGAYKSLVASALLMLPVREMPYFLDALEWISNPDPDVDQRLFAGTCCRVYAGRTDHASAWASLARRMDDDAPLPYMIAFVACRGIIVQIHLPLCSRDDDSGESCITLPERWFGCGLSSNFRQAGSTLVPVVLSRDLGRFPGRRSLVEC